MELDDTLRKGFRLGDWEIRPIEGLVSGAQGQRHLQPKTVDVLVSLAAASGEVVTRDELIERVWGEHAVSDEPLTRCIHEIRRALDDHREHPTYIQTIPKRGYRLLVQVDAPTPDESLIETSAAPNASLFWQVTRQRVLWVGAAYAALAWVFVSLARYAENIALLDRAPPTWLMPALVMTLLLGFPVAVFFAWVRQLQTDDSRLTARFPGLVSLVWSRRGIDVILVTLVISILAGFAFDVIPPSNARHPHYAGKSIAVLPFAGSANSDQANWLGEGFADSLRDSLKRYEYLDVSSRQASTSKALAKLETQQIGANLDVRYLLEGWVIWSSEDNDRVRVNARLIDAMTGLELWSETLARDAADLFELKRLLTNGVISTLALEGSPRAAGAEPQSINMAAYGLYLRGVQQLRLAASVADVETAIALLDEALQGDPRLPMARNQLCQAQVRRFELDASDQHYAAANQSCAEAQLQNPESIDARMVLADFYRISGHPDQARKEFQWVADRQPGNPDAWLGVAESNRMLGVNASAERAYHRALAAAPDHLPSLDAYTSYLLSQRRYDDVVDHATQLVRLDRNRAESYENLASALFMSGRFEDAIQANRYVISLDGAVLDAVKNIAQSYYFLERFERASSIYRQAATMLPNDHEIYGMLATSYRQQDGAHSNAMADAMFRKARALVGDLLAGQPDDSFALASLAYYTAALDEAALARQLLSPVTGDSDTGLSVEAHYLAALAWAELGEQDAALSAMQQAVALGYPRILMQSDPLLAAVWGERRFLTARLLPSSGR